MCIYGLFGHLDDCEREFFWFSVRNMFGLDLRIGVVVIGFVDLCLGVTGSIAISYFIYMVLHRWHLDEFWIAAFIFGTCIFIALTGNLTLLTASRQTPYRVNFSTELHLWAVLLFCFIILLTVILWRFLEYDDENAELSRFTIIGNSAGIVVYSYFTAVLNGFRIGYLRSLRRQGTITSAVYL